MLSLSIVEVINRCNYKLKLMGLSNST